MSDTSAAKAFRVLPRVNDANEFFWTSGADGNLRFLRCGDCRQWLHPPSPRCPNCLSKNLAPEVVSGRATVHTYTINYQPWYPNFDPPYVVAVVAIEEQPSLRLMTNIVNCAPDDVAVGMAVQVMFEQYDDVWIPLFEPRAT
jgi:uncharacterized OB-fold protein